MLRVSVLGSTALVDRCVPTAGAGLVVTSVPPAAEPGAVLDGQPDAVVAFDPGDEQRELVDGLGLPALLWWSRTPSGRARSDRMRQRTIAPTDGPGVWRTLAPPVADALFGEPVTEPCGRAQWLGPGGRRREAYLGYFEHRTELVPAEDDGPGGDTPSAPVALNLHDEDEPACEHRALVALARGQLLVSETLVPARGLEPNIDYLEARDFDDAFLAVENAARAPEAFRRVHLCGRRKAELFRASRVVERLVGDLLLEVR